MSFLGRHGAAFAFAFLLTAVPAFAVASTAYGALYLSTLPSGANVWIDGTYVGRTPVLVDPLARGHHAVTLTKAGCSVQEVDVDVTEGTTVLRSFLLRSTTRGGSQRASGSVALRGLPDSAHVTIDGDLVEHNLRAVLPMTAGTHVAVVVMSERKLARTFTVYPEMTTQVLFTDSVADERPSAIVAPAEEFLPDSAYSIDGTKVIVRYEGHRVVAKLGEVPMHVDGAVVSYDAAPSRINGRLYLPLALLTKLTQSKTK